MKKPDYIYILLNLFDKDVIPYSNLKIACQENELPYYKVFRHLQVNNYYYHENIRLSREKLIKSTRK